MATPTFLGDGLTQPRSTQKDYFRHLHRTWDQTKIHGAHLPPGYGKTYIAKTIQNVFGPDAVIITISNHLLDQYLDTYPTLNPLKGRVHYPSVEEYRHVFEAVPYRPSIANPLSYYYGRLSGRLPAPKVLIIDEAHKLKTTMQLAAYMDFSVNELGIPTFKDDYDLFVWVRDMLNRCQERLELLHTLTSSQKDWFFGIHEQLLTLNQLLKDGTHTFTYDYAFKKYRGIVQKVLRIEPLRLGKALFKPFLDAQKIVTLSGTFTRYDLKFFDQEADYYTGEYLTRPENRLVRYTPVAESQRKNPQTLAKRILAIWEDEGRPNTVVHVTYDMSTKIKQYLPDAITHTKDTKDAAIKRFKLDGGMLLACGCAEGVDLPDDLCRLIIIPVLQYPNLGEASVRKKKALPGGTLEYNLDTMMTTVQQLGRGTRHADDRCKSYILDPLFSMLYNQTFEYLPNALNIDWVAR